MPPLIGVGTPNLGVRLNPSLHLRGKKREEEMWVELVVLDSRLKACPCKL